VRKLRLLRGVRFRIGCSQIVRTAMTPLPSRPTLEKILTWRETGCSDPDPMVRIGALDTLENASANQIWPLVSPLLSDPVRGVRLIFIVWLAAFANSAQERDDPKAIFKDYTKT
jgi:hypothetical protein